MTTPIQIDHEQQAVDKLPSQWGDKYQVDNPTPDRNITNVQKLMQAWARPLNDLEEDAFAVRSGFNLNTAIGTQLDILGELIGVPRLGRGDKQYRQAILTRLAAASGSGTINDILNLLSALTQGADTDLWEHYPLGYICGVDALPDRTIPPLIKEATAAGIDGGYVIFTPRGDEVIPNELKVGQAYWVTESGDQMITESGDDYVLDTLLEDVGVFTGVFPDPTDPQDYRPLAHICYLDSLDVTETGYGQGYGLDWGGTS